MSERIPDLADALAAVNQFRQVEESDTAFFQKHWMSLRVGCCVLEHWATDENRALLSVMSLSELDAAAATFRELLAEPWLTDEQNERADRQLETSLRSLYKVCQDPDLPAWLGPARQVINSMFQTPP